MRAVAAVWTVVWLVVGTLATVATVGKERKPLTGGTAAATVLINASFIIAVWYLW